METAIVVLITVAIVTYLATVIHAATRSSLDGHDGGERPEAHLITWPRWMFGLLLVLVSLCLLYEAAAILTPFLLGGRRGLRAQPAGGSHGRPRLPRGRAVALIFLLLLVVVVFAVFLIVPASRVKRAPSLPNTITYAHAPASMWSHLRATPPSTWRESPRYSPSEARRLTLQFNQRLAEWGSGRLPSRPEATPTVGLELLLLLVVTPVVAFWLLRDYHGWERCSCGPFRRPIAPDTVEIASDINRIVGGFVLGLLTMIVLVATYSSLVLTLLRRALLTLARAAHRPARRSSRTSASLPPWSIIALTMASTGQGVGMIVLALVLHIVGNIASDYLVYPRVVGGASACTPSSSSSPCSPEAPC